MLKLHVLQAECGDCLILEYGTPSNPKYILIDGGPDTIYQKYLKSQLQEINNTGGELETVILSHVDNDHIIGLIEMTTELRAQRDSNATETIKVKEIWFNSFTNTIGSGTNIESRIKNVLLKTAGTGMIPANTEITLKGISEGDHLRKDAILLKIPINPEFPNKVITVDKAPNEIVLDNLTLRIVGPTQKNIDELRIKWLEWLDKYEENIDTQDPLLVAMSDRSIPNLSSIMIYAEAEGKKLLLMGDGRGDHLLEGLDKTNLLDAKGTMQVDVLKVPHHGSDRNVSKKFFKNVVADKYIISTNGKDDNPDLATLIWIVEAAREQARQIQILATNKTESTEKLVKDYDPNEYGYEIVELNRSFNSLVLNLSPKVTIAHV